jgi:hypothetical protein
MVGSAMAITGAGPGLGRLLRSIFVCDVATKHNKELMAAINIFFICKYFLLKIQFNR